MAVEGIAGISDTVKRFVYDVRFFTRDFPELNRLLRGEESSDRQILWAALDAVSDFNGTPHLTNYSLEDLLSFNLHSLMRRMTTISLIESVGLLQTRNHLNYTNGRLSVGVSDKTPLLMNWLQLFRSSTDQMKQRVKIALNIGGILGSSNFGVSSEYWAVNSSYSAY